MRYRCRSCNRTTVIGRNDPIKCTYCGGRILSKLRSSDVKTVDVK